MKEDNKKPEHVQKEEDILKFWKENNIFEKSLQKSSPKGEFVFYDGPPFATGLPHYGHILASTIKDVVPRYQTMRGYHVTRRWGWDTHGLPIETLVEKKLGIKEKKEIETIGIDTFNETARSLVLEYVHEWKKTVDRIGRWVDFDGSYKTMDNTYIESVWWTLSELAKREFVYEGLRVLPYCTRCETPLAKAEIAMDNSYKDVTDEAVTVKFKIIGFDSAYFLAWTTTPWTLPGNVALAVGKDIAYVEIKVGEEILVLAKERLSEITQSYEIIAEHNGGDMVGMQYEPLYEIDAVKSLGKKSHYIVSGDFVTTEDGTGIVHTAVIYGEEDFNLGKEKDLPMVQLLDSRGHFNDKAPDFVRGEYFKKANKLVTLDLENRGLVFSHAPYKHSYPHCYRCDTPLIYNALPAWFINIQKIKPALINKNEDINWVPNHLKHGRFLHIVENAPDWNISRNRYWASPLPIWKCSACAKIHFVGGLDDLKLRTKKSGNAYFVMRHGVTSANGHGAVSVADQETMHVTPDGLKVVAQSAESLIGKGITRIIASPFTRTRETAETVARVIGIDPSAIVYDERLREMNPGNFGGSTWPEYHNKFSKTVENFYCSGDGGDTYADVKNRTTELLYELEAKYANEKILIVTHGAPAWLLVAGSRGNDAERSLAMIRDKELYLYLQNAEYSEIPFVVLPHNKNYELDLHRPYIDGVELVCDCGGDMKRIPEVVDCWVESAVMPHASRHYPFENKEEFAKNFPAQFVAEYIAQTRTWFYYSHVINTILFDRAPFENIVTTGNVQNEKGEKMSKSKQNFPDPWEVINRFGVDALRYYLISSPVMRAEDMNFSEKGVDEIHKKLILRLRNVLSFYQMYQSESLGKISARPKVDGALDRWILTRLDQVTSEVTLSMNAYELDRATWPFMDFVDDFSVWYLRRSRDRVKDGGEAFETLRYVLFILAKLLAPFTPFVAEEIYKLVGGEMESVHLEEWPEEGGRAKVEDGARILENMQKTRDVVSKALELRAKANIKVRQPLGRLKIEGGSLGEEYLQLIKEEVNVKEVVMGEEFALDTEITPELKCEGDYRDLVREVQDLRKEKGLKPTDVVTVSLPEKYKETLAGFEEDFKKTVSAKDVIFDGVDISLVL